MKKYATYTFKGFNFNLDNLFITQFLYADAPGYAHSTKIHTFKIYLNFHTRQSFDFLYNNFFLIYIIHDINAIFVKSLS